MKLKDASVPNGSEVNLFSSATSGRCGRPQHESRWHTSVATAVPSQVAESKRSSDQSEWRKFASGEILGNSIGGRTHGSTARSTVASHAERDSGEQVVRGSVGRAHLRQRALCGLPWALGGRYRRSARANSINQFR